MSKEAVAIKDILWSVANIQVANGQENALLSAGGYGFSQEFFCLLK